MSRSKFPSEIDSIPELSNVLASDQTNIDRYKILLMKASRTTAEEVEFANLKTTLATKLVSSEHFNYLADAIVATQDYFLNKVKTDLAKLDVSVVKAALDQHANDTSDPHQSYAQAISWVKSFGLGTSSVKVTGDLNTSQSNGFFFTEGETANKPSTSNGWVINQYLDNDYQTQMFIDSVDGNIYLRTKISGIWQTWNALRKDMPAYVKYSSPLDVITLNANIWTSLLYGNYVVDTKGVTYSQNKLTFTKRGVFLFTTNLAISGLTSGQHLRIRYLHKNSDGVAKGDDQSYIQSGYDTLNISNGNYIGGTLSTIIKADFGDTLEIYAACSENSRTIRYVRVNAIESGNWN